MIEEIKLRKEMEKTFVRGEVQALTWVLGGCLLTKPDHAHISARLALLLKYLSGEIEADRDGTIPRPVPEFGKGET